MNNENYINIQGWMINELKLKGNELVLYAIIYGFSQDGKSEYYGSVRYISKAMQITPGSASKILNKLIEKKLITRTSESHYITNRGFQSDTVKKGGVSKVTQRGFQSDTIGVSKVIQINNNTNNNDNDNIDFPKNINKKMYLIWIKDRKERKLKKLTERGMKLQFKLLEKYSLEEQEQIINNSIEKSWTGLFHLNKKNNYKKKTPELLKFNKNKYEWDGKTY